MECRHTCEKGVFSDPKLHHHVYCALIGLAYTRLGTMPLGIASSNHLKLQTVYSTVSINSRAAFSSACVEQVGKAVRQD